MKRKLAIALEERITADTRRKIESIVGLMNGKKKNVLDLGCGERGSFDYGGLKVTGADRIKERVTGKAFRKIVADVDKKLPFKSKEFDIVVFSGVIQYLNYPARAIKEINRVLKPRGILVLTTVNRNSFLRILGFIGREPKTFAGEKRIYPPQELKRLLHTCNFRVLNILGADFIFMPASLSSNLVLVAVKG